MVAVVASLPPAQARASTRPVPIRLARLSRSRHSRRSRRSFRSRHNRRSRRSRRSAERGLEERDRPHVVARAAAVVVLRAMWRHRARLLVEQRHLAARSR